MDINTLGQVSAWAGNAPAAAMQGRVVGSSAVDATVEDGPQAVEDPAKAVNVTLARAAQDEEAVKESVEALNDFISPYVTSLRFSVDKEAGGKFVVKILDTETNEVIKQIPSEKVLALAKALTGVMGKPEGLLVEQEA